MGERRLIDLSHVIEHGTITYKGLPAPIVCDYLSREESRAIYDEGTEFQIARIDMVANTGTYLDTPFHRYADGCDLSGLKLETVSGVVGLVVDATGVAGRAIGPEMFDGLAVAGHVVLVRTGWDQHWGSDTYFEDYPFLTEAAGEYLRDAGAVLVGIDSHNIDDNSGGERPVHSVLLGAGIPIVEHMTGLDQLPASGFRFYAVPPKFKGVGTFPVRAHALVG